MLKALQLTKPYRQTLISDLRTVNWRTGSARSFIFLVLCVGISIGLFYTTKRLLREIANISQYIYLPHEQVLGLFLLFLLFALIVSNLAISLGRFYHSTDLELILAAPVSFSSIYLSKLILICIASSWMPLIFLFPVVFAFLQDANQINFFSAWASVVLFLPYFLLPTGISICLATLFLYFSPRYHSRTLALVFVAVVLGIVYKVIGIFTESTDDLLSTSGIIRAVNILALPQLDWLPTNWIARSFNSLMQGQSYFKQNEFWLLVFSSVGACALGYVILVLLFDKALERERGAKATGGKHGSFFIKFSQLIFKAGYIRALCFKEFTLIFRETAQVVQLVLLFILGFLYVYNLETLASASEFTARFDTAWTQFLAIVSLAVGCFFVLAISTRIIFPSVSLEGRNFWFLMSKPLTPEHMLKVKFWIWFIPMAILSVSFFLLGASALNLNSLLMPTVAVFALLSAYGVVGLAIGLGAKFANFDWEYSTQLIASFGSIFYMLTAIALLTITCIPLGLLVILAHIPHVLINMSLFDRTLVFTFIVLGIWLPHALAVSWSFQDGCRELRKRLT